MPLFRKKPIVITAFRTDEPLLIKTLEGNMQADIGDWIIEGVRGEFYPCKDDVFRTTYEPVDDEGVTALAAPAPAPEDVQDEESCILPFPTTSVTT